MLTLLSVVFFGLAHAVQLANLTVLKGLLSGGASIIYAPFDGECPAPGSAYENSTHVYNVGFVSHPRVVIQAATTADVSWAIKFFNLHSISFRIHSSGHNLAGYSGATCAQYLLDLSRLRHLQRVGNTTVYGPGIMSWELFEFLLPYREVVVSCDPSLHALGMTLVGGLSELTTVQGLSTDLVVEFEVVVADGRIVTASAKKNADLFFALRGAGSNSFGVVTSATIRAIKVPADMGKGQYVFVDPSEAGIQKFMRGYRDELILSNKSGVSADMGVYLTIAAVADVGRVFLLDWTYFGPNMASARQGLDSWVRKLAAASNLAVTESPPGSLTYEDYVRNYAGKVANSGTPEEWLSPFMTSISDNLLQSFSTLTNTAVSEGANSASILILAQQVNGRPAGLALKGDEASSAFPFRQAKLWLLDIASCPFSSEFEESPCRRFVRNLFTATKRDRGYMGLYHGVQNRYLETQPNFVQKEYFAQSANPGRWRKLLAAKKSWDPKNIFCAPQSVIPCSAPSSDACIARGPPPTP